MDADFTYISMKSEALKCGNCCASFDILSGGRSACGGSKADISTIDWILCKEEA